MLVGGSFGAEVLVAVRRGKGQPRTGLQIELPDLF